MASSVQPRLDALFHGTYHSEAIESLRTGERKVCPLREVVQSVEEPNRFKRIVLDAESLGAPLFGTSAIFWNDPEPSYYLPKKLAMPYIVTRKTLLIPRSGQLSGVIGRVVLPYGDIVHAGCGYHRQPRKFERPVNQRLPRRQCLTAR